MPKFPPIGCVVLFALLTAGCTAGLVNPQVPPPGSAAFQLGYLRGCAAGFADAGRDGYHSLYVADGRDSTRYASDADYRGGWDRGHAACFEEEHRAPAMIGSSP